MTVFGTRLFNVEDFTLSVHVKTRTTLKLHFYGWLWGWNFVTIRGGGLLF